MRAEELIEGRPELVAAIRPLLEARSAVEQQVNELDRKVMKLARHDAQIRRFMHRTWGRSPDLASALLQGND